MLTTKTLLLALFLVIPLSGQAADADARLRTVDLSAEASVPAANDLGVATMYVEQTQTDAAALAREINRTISAALDISRAHADIKTQSAGISTSPVYAKGGSRIDAWRMRSEIRLESRNSTSLSALVGKLQETLNVSQISMQPSPETRRKATEEAMVAALRNFEQRAELIASTLGKRYILHRLNVSESGYRPPVYAKMRNSAMMADAAPAPIEGGESDVSVTVSGAIELLD